MGLSNRNGAVLWKKLKMRWTWGFGLAFPYIYLKTHIYISLSLPRKALSQMFTSALLWAFVANPTKKKGFGGGGGGGKSF